MEIYSPTRITPVRRVIGGIALSAVGNGLVLPFFVVYLHSIRGISIGRAGLILSWMGLAQILFAPIVGTAVDRFGARRVLHISLLMGALGYASLGYAHSIRQIVLVVTLCALSQGAMWPSQSVFLARLSSDRERIFGLQFALLNLGLGIGGLVASLALSTVSERAFHLLYVVDGFSYMVYLAIVYSVQLPPLSDEEKEMKDGSWREVIKDKKLLRVWIIAFIAILFGYSQLEVGFTSFSTYVANFPPSYLAWAFAANMFVIALFQMRFVSIVRNWRRSRALMLATSFWALAWFILGFTRWYQSILILILCQIVFSVGEMIWSPVAPALVNDLAPENMRGRYNALFSGAWQSGMILGPGLSGALIGSGEGMWWVIVVVAGSLGAGFLALRLRTILTPEQERGRIGE